MRSRLSAPFLEEMRAFGPLADDRTVNFRPIIMEGKIRPYILSNNLLEQINGSVVYASKPLFMSFGLGLINKICKKHKIVLDIDDWDYGFIKDFFSNLNYFNKALYLGYSSLFVYDNMSYWNNFMFEKITRFADAVTVSNTFLQRKFGGEIIWHARDCREFDPSLFDQTILREKYGLSSERKYILFLGSPRPHKGIEDLIQAVKYVGREDTSLLLVGLDDSDYCKKIKSIGLAGLGDKIAFWPNIPFSQVPEVLTLADIVVVPQREQLSSYGQFPAKIFDAMAMAKPIISTNVSDIPLILDQCGWITDPGSYQQLAEAIHYVLDHPSIAQNRALSARQKCIRNYSYDSVGQRLDHIIQSLL